MIPVPPRYVSTAKRCPCSMLFRSAGGAPDGGARARGAVQHPRGRPLPARLERCAGARPVRRLRRARAGGAVAGGRAGGIRGERRSEEQTSELQSLMRISYAVFCLKQKNEKHYISCRS